MISTRHHAVFDYASAGLLGLLSCSRRVPPRVRTVLSLAAAATAGLASQTDYEGGVRPRLAMRTHLLLDLVGGAALCAAGLRMRQAPASRVLLLGLGATAVSVALRSSSLPVTGPSQGGGVLGRISGGEERAGYLPLHVPKPVAEDVWIVDSTMSGPGGVQVPLRMTVLRLPGGGLLLHSPVRFSPALHEAVAALGPIEHLVAPNSVHWLFMADWQRACPGATTWAAPGLRDRKQVRRAGLRLDRDLRDGAPPEWGGAVQLTTIPAAFGLREVTMLHRPTGVLLLTDLVVNLDPAKLPAPFRPVARLLGVTAPNGMSPPWARMVFLLRRRDAAAAAQAVLRDGPRRVIFAHGNWFAQDGTARLRHSWRWLLDGVP